MAASLLVLPLSLLPACGGEEEVDVEDGVEEAGDDDVASDGDELRSSEQRPSLTVDPTLRFVAMGDTGKGNQGQKDVAAAIEKHCASRGCDFVQGHFLGRPVDAAQFLEMARAAGTPRGG